MAVLYKKNVDNCWEW